MFEYKKLPRLPSAPPRDRLLFLLSASLTGSLNRAPATAEGSVDVPALGPPNAPSELAGRSARRSGETAPGSAVPTAPFGVESHGGSSPSGVLASRERIYVANA
jgi:hypothetical protein